MPPNIFFLCLTLHPAAVAESAHDSAADDIFWAGLCRPALDMTQVHANMPSAIWRLSKPAVRSLSATSQSATRQLRQSPHGIGHGEERGGPDLSFRSGRNQRVGRKACRFRSTRPSNTRLSGATQPEQKERPSNWKRRVGKAFAALHLALEVLTCCSRAR